jgi:site-specific DNA recombinase
MWLIIGGEAEEVPILTTDSIRVALYARVSTDMQAETGKSIAAQLTEMRTYAQRHGWEVVQEFVDPGRSGTNMDRPGLNDLRAAVQVGTLDIVLVHELSRLSRRLFDTFELLEFFGQHQVGFASVKDRDFDFTSPTDRLFLTFLAALNQYYVDLLKMHTRKSKKQRSREGLYNASTPPYGYRHTGDADTPPVIVPEEAAAVREMFAKYATGKYTYQDIAEWLSQDAGYYTREGNAFSKDTVADMIRNPFYKGCVRYRGGQRNQDHDLIFDGEHQEIVAKETWERCRQVREQRRVAPRTYQPAYHVYLLNGLVTCDVCGRNLRAQGAKTGSYYREVSKIRGFTDCPHAGRGARMEQVDAQVNAIFRLVRLPDDWQAELAALVEDEEDRETLDNRRARLIAERRRLKHMKIKGEFETDPEVYHREQRRIRRELAELPAPGDFASLERAATLLTDLTQVWDEAALIERRDLLRLALKEVKVDVPQARLVTLEPYPIFVPLFRQVELLREVDFGIFVPVWPPELGAKREKVVALPAWDALPPSETAPHWPSVPTLPHALQRAQSTPPFSRWLGQRRRDEQPLAPVVALAHPTAPALQVDERYWNTTITQVRTLHEVAPETAAFLWTPFALQDSIDRPEFITQVRAALAPTGTWVLIDRLPSAMPAHWLYTYFPETWDNACQHTLDTAQLYRTLQQSGFDVELKRHTCYQPVALADVLRLATEREALPQLRNLPHHTYQVRLEALRHTVAQRGGETLVSGEFCVVESTARRSPRSKG